MRLPALLLAALVFLFAAPASAATLFSPATGEAAAVEPGLTAAELDRLIATLDDESARTELVTQLQALRDAVAATAPAEAEAPDTLFGLASGYFSERLAALSAQFAGVTEALEDLPQALDSGLDRIRSDAWQKRTVEWSIVLLVVALASLSAFWVLNRLLRGVRHRLVVRGARGELALRAFLLAMRLVVEVLPIILFVIVASTVLAAFSPAPLLRRVALALIQGTVLVMASRIVLRALLAPKTPALRLLPIGDEGARAIYRAALRLATTAFGGFYLIQALFWLGMPAVLRDALETLLGLLVAVFLIVDILRLRAPAARLLLAYPGRSWLGGLQRGAADVWHIFAIVVVLAGFAVWALGIEGGLLYLVRAVGLTVLILILARLLDLGVRRLVAARLQPGRDAEARAIRRFLPVLASVGRIAIAVLAVALIAQAWGIDVYGFLASDFGGRIASSLISIVLIAIAAYVVWHVATALIERKLRENAEAKAPGRLEARLRTILPLLRSVILIVLVTMVALIALSELGINIAPLIAGAGVVGLAVGFGSQELVKDVITGLFILFENQIQIGDVVDVGGGHVGSVEAMSIRTLQIRDGDGKVHILRWGNVQSVTNMTRGFAYAQMNVGVGYREDIDHVMDVIRALGAELRSDPDYADQILGDLEMNGIDSFSDSGVIVQFKFKTPAGKQWGVLREMRRRLKRRFDELGIQMPLPSRTVYFGESRDGTAVPARIRLTGETPPAPAAGAAVPQVEGPSPAAEPVPGTRGV